MAESERKPRWVDLCVGGIVGVLATLVGGAALKYLDWYHEAQAAVHSIPRVVIVGTYSGNVGYARKNIFQAETRYTVGYALLKFGDEGEKTSQDFHLQVKFPDGVTVRGVRGARDMEIQRADGSFVQVSKVADDWPDSEKIVLARMDKVQPGIENSMVIEFYYDTGTTPERPSALGWDDMATYEVSWEQPK